MEQDFLKKKRDGRERLEVCLRLQVLVDQSVGASAVFRLCSCHLEEITGLLSSSFEGGPVAGGRTYAK